MGTKGWHWQAGPAVNGQATPQQPGPAAGGGASVSVSPCCTHLRPQVEQEALLLPDLLLALPAVPFGAALREPARGMGRSARQRGGACSLRAGPPPLPGCAPKFQLRRHRTGAGEGGARSAHTSLTASRPATCRSACAPGRLCGHPALHLRHSGPHAAGEVAPRLVPVPAALLVVGGSADVLRRAPPLPPGRLSAGKVARADNSTLHQRHC